MTIFSLFCLQLTLHQFNLNIKSWALELSPGNRELDLCQSIHSFVHSFIHSFVLCSLSHTVIPHQSFQNLNNLLIDWFVHLLIHFPIRCIHLWIPYHFTNSIKLNNKEDFICLDGLFCLFHLFLVACYATLHPALSVRRSVGWSVGRSVGWSVGRSVPILLFLFVLLFWPHRSCPNGLVT